MPAMHPGGPRWRSGIIAVLDHDSMVKARFGARHRGMIGQPMILGTLWRTIQAQLNKLAISSGPPTRSRRCSRSTTGRWPSSGRDGSGWPSTGRSSSGWAARWPGNEANVKRLEATVKTYLARAIARPAGRFALELQRARQELAENQAQLRLHEQAYENNLLKIKHAGGKLARDPRQDRPVRRRPQDERGRGRDGQARPGVPLRRRPPTSAQLEVGSRNGSTSTGRRCASPSTSPARASRPSARKRPPEASLPRTRFASSNARWSAHRARRPLADRASPIGRRRPGPRWPRGLESRTPTPRVLPRSRPVRRTHLGMIVQARACIDLLLALP